MLQARIVPSTGGRAPLLLSVQQQQQRSCICHARRGRPSRTAEDDVMDRIEQEPAPAKRKGRKKKTEVAPAPTAAEAPLTTEMQPETHERVVSIEDMTSSVELDYTDNPTLIVPSYTHQAQGHESATQPPLDNFVPNFDSPGFVGSEELPRQQQQQQQQPQPAAPLQQQEDPQQQLAESLLQQRQQLQLQQQQQHAELPPFQQQQQEAMSLGVQVAQQEQVGPDIGSAAGPGGDGGEDDELLGYDDPPGLFDYEAGLPFATIEHPPERPMQYMPQHMRAKNRRQADYMLRYISYLGDVERQEREDAYKEKALYYHLQQVKESENVYVTGKALSVVMAEIELEDAQTGNRTDSFYPTWARAEHRWYPSGRFAAYNQYVKENLPDLTVKYAPGADQEEDFDIMDDVLLMADDPSMPGGAAGAGDEEEGQGNPAAGLSLDSFMGQGMLPGAGSSELGQAYLEDVLSPAADEELEEELLD